MAKVFDNRICRAGSTSSASKWQKISPAFGSFAGIHGRKLLKTSKTQQKKIWYVFDI
jgi:hypothetical protein